MSEQRPTVTPLVLVAALALACLSGPAWALSEIQREELPAPGAQAPLPPASATPPDANTPDANAPAEDGAVADPSAPAAQPGSATDDAPAAAENTALPQVSYDLAALPEPVRRMHDLLLDACRSADIEKLRSLLGTGEDATQVSLSDVNGEVIAFLKESSGDGQGLEILAILEEVLSAGYVHTDIGTDEELFVWPYFFAIPLDRLTGRQQVELYKIVTSSDVEEMRSFGAYIFYRVGITPEGRWAFFVAGD